MLSYDWHIVMDWKKIRKAYVKLRLAYSNGLKEDKEGLC